MDAIQFSGQVRPQTKKIHRTPTRPSQVTFQGRKNGQGFLGSLAGKAVVTAGALAASVGLVNPPEAQAEISAKSKQVMEHGFRHIQVRQGRNGDWVKLNDVNHGKLDVLDPSVQWNWDDLKPHQWQDVSMVLRVTDSVGEADAHFVRLRLLKDGPHNANIPMHVVHETLDTTREFGANITDALLAKSKYYAGSGKTAENLRSEMSSVLEDYETMTIIQGQVPDGDGGFKPTREFVAGSGGQYAYLQRMARHARAKIGDDAYLKRYTDKLLEVSKSDDSDNVAKRTEYFDRIAHAPVDKPIPAALQRWVLEQIYGEDALKGAGNNDDGGDFFNEGGDDLGIDSARPGAKGVGTLALDEDLKSPKMPSDRTSNSSKKEAVARYVLYLAERYDKLTDANKKLVLPAIGQWFESNKPQSSSGYSYYSSSRAVGQASSADHMMMESLATLAGRKGDDADAAYKVLQQVTASRPDWVFTAYYRSEGSTRVSAETDAGNALRAAFASRKAANKEAFHKFIIDMADRKADLLWDTDKYYFKQADADKVTDKGRKWALMVMSNDLDPAKPFVPYLRKVAADKDEELRWMAINGLILAQDKGTVPMLMGMATNENAPLADRAEALYGILAIGGPPLIDPTVAGTISDSLPLSARGIGLSSSFLEYTDQPVLQLDERTRTLSPKVDTKGKPVTEKTLVFNPSARPWSKRVDHELELWKKRQDIKRDYAIAQKKLGKDVQVPPPLKEVDYVMALTEIRAKLFGTKSDMLRDMGGNDASFQKAARGLVAHLENSKGEGNDRGTLNLPYLGLPMLDILGKSGTRADVVDDIVQNPSQYHMKMETGHPMFDLLFEGFQPAILRVVALENMGGMLDPTAKHEGQYKMDVLLGELGDDYTPYRFAALEGIRKLGRQEMPGKVKQHYVDLAMAQFANQQAGRMEIDQMRWYGDYIGQEYATALVELGCKDALLQRAKELQAQNPNHPTLRTIAQGIAYVGHQQSDGKGYNPPKGSFEEQLYRRANRMVSPGISLDEIHSRYGTGKGGALVHFDIPFAKPIDSIKDKLVHPDWMRPFDFWNWEVTDHATATADLVNKVAPGIAKIYSYNAIENIRHENPFISMDAGDPLLWSLEDAIQNQIRAEGDPKRTDATVSNSSIGIWNLILYDKQFREDFMDRLAAYYEGLGVTGVSNQVAASNSQGAGWADSYDPTGTGTVSTLASRNIGKDQLRRPASTQISAAVDLFMQRVAEFSSMGSHAQRDKGISTDLIGSWGYRNTSAWRDRNGQWNPQDPWEGTSASTPELSGIIHLAKMARAATGDPWSMSELDAAVHRNTKQLPGWRDYEGGNVINTEALLGEATKAAPKKK